MNTFLLYLRNWFIAIMAVMVMAFSSVTTAVPLAEFVTYQAGDGPKLNALLYLPKTSGKSVVIMIPGGTGGFIGGAHDYTPMAEKLTAQGYAFLLANMRTAGRHGWLFGRFEDSEQDVGAAVKFAKSRGFDNIILFGTSLGGPRVVYYWTQTKEPSIKVMGFLGAITSPYLEAQVRFDKAKCADFDGFLQKARDLVKAGKGHETIAYPWFSGYQLTLSAESYINYFGTLKESNASTIKFTEQLTLPTLVVHGDSEEIALPPVAEQIFASLSAAPKRDLVWIKGASHYLSPGPIAEKYAQAIVEWVLTVSPPVP